MVVVDQVRNIGSLRFRAPSSPGCRARTCPGSPRKGTFWPARTRAARTGSAAYCSNRARNSMRKPTSRTRRPSSSWPPTAARGRYPRPRRRPSGRSRAAAGAPKWRRWSNPSNRQAGRTRRPSPARTAPFDCSREGYRRTLPRQGHAARQGAESRGEEAARGDLRDRGGQGSVRSLTVGGNRRPGRACVSIAKNAHRKGESLLTELQEHPHARELP